jgi:hypothetical protein
MKFDEAIGLVLAGKKVRRRSWKHCHLERWADRIMWGCVNMFIWRPEPDDMTAEDWECL